MKSLSRYRGVSRPGDGALGWVAQRKGYCYAARFASEQHAAQWLVRRLGVPVSSLLRVQVARGKEAGDPYRGVVYHSGCWEARVAGAVRGYYGSPQKALKEVMRVTGKTKKQLIRKQGFSRPTLETRFRCKRRIFGSYEPGDVKSMYEHETKYARMYRQDTSCMIFT